MSIGHTPNISVVITVKNEGSTVSQLIESLELQTMKPNEIIVVDGGSTDQTSTIVRSYKRVIYLHKNGNRSVGRNYGIERARNKLVALTDGGCVADKDWIKSLIHCFRGGNEQVIAGFYNADSRTVFEKCMAPYALIMPDKVIESSFLPSARSMLITKNIWAQNGMFPEQYSHNEDYVFARNLKKNGVKIRFCKKAVVFWRPRGDLISASKMFFRFAYGDAESGLFRPKVLFIFIRYIAGIMLFINGQFLILAALLGLYFLWSINKNYKYVRNYLAIFWLPIIQITSDICILIGTTGGLIKGISKFV